MNLTDENLPRQGAGVISTDLTRGELKAALNQYLRMLKDAGIATLPKGMGHFSAAFAAVENLAAEVVVERKSQTDLLSLPADTTNVAKEAGMTYLTKAELDNSAADKTAPSPRSSASNSSRQKSLIGSESNAQASADQTSYAPSLSTKRRQEELQIVESVVKGCTKCAELSRCRNRVVFGVGNIAPRLVFLGEAPGADEDRQGEPFVGAAGQLLNKIIEACKLSRSEVYILNTIKCHPPGNRNPTPDELENCWEYTQRQLEILRPEFICCLGLIATKQLLKTSQPLGQMRQKCHRYRDSRVVVTYHPAYLLRTESAKKYVWEDMKMLMGEMGILPDQSFRS